MTTNSSIPPPATVQPRRALRWIPQSGTAWVILILGALCAAEPAFYAAGAAVLMYVCFDECGSAVQVTTWALIAAAVALSPLAVVRLYQGERPASARGRLAITASLILALAALTWCTWTGLWPL